MSDRNRAKIAPNCWLAGFRLRLGPVGWFLSIYIPFLIFILHAATPSDRDVPGAITALCKYKSSGVSQPYIVAAHLKKLNFMFFAISFEPLHYSATQPNCLHPQKRQFIDAQILFIERSQSCIGPGFLPARGNSTMNEASAVTIKLNNLRFLGVPLLERGELLRSKPDIFPKSLNALCAWLGKTAANILAI